VPLETGSSPAVKRRNIREMIRAGHPARQAVAAALNNARKGKRGKRRSRRGRR
jgi:hypothetical protein